MVFVRGILGEEHEVYVRGCRMIGPERQQRRETRPGWGDSSAAGGCAHTSSRRAGRHAREATLTRSLGAVKDRDLLVFLAEDLRGVNAALRKTPRDMGLGGTLWDGKTLAAWIAEEYEIDLGVRQCQRLFRQLGFRLRKPRPSIAQADPERQKAHKKNSKR